MKSTASEDEFDSTAATSKSMRLHVQCESGARTSRLSYIPYPVLPFPSDGATSGSVAVVSVNVHGSGGAATTGEGSALASGKNE